MASGDEEQHDRIEVLGWRFSQKQLRWTAAAAVVLIAGLFLLFSGHSSPQKPGPDQAKGSAQAAVFGTSGAPTGSSYQIDQRSQQRKQLEQELTSALSGVKGAGKVTVRIRLASSRQISYQQDTQTSNQLSHQKDSQGGEQQSRNTSSKSTTVKGSGTGALPVRVDAPRIAGVIVVASGASDPQVKEALNEAVQTYLGVQAYQVYVLTGGQ